MDLVTDLPSFRSLYVCKSDPAVFGYFGRTCESSAYCERSQGKKDRWRDGDVRTDGWASMPGTHDGPVQPGRFIRDAYS